MLSSEIYVDSLFGDDLWDGSMTSPVKTLSYAVSQAPIGAVIVLQTGDKTSYGSVSVTKNLTIRRAHGASPIVGTITVRKAQGHFNGLKFDSITDGIVVTNDPLGSVLVEECFFDTVTNAIVLNGVNYVSILRNTFSYHTVGVKIDSAVEVVINSNVFSNGSKAIEIGTVDRLDLWRNTVYGAALTGGVGSPDTQMRIIYRTLSSSNITNKKIPLPGVAATNAYGYDVAMNVVYGPSFNYGTDFTVISGTMVSWAGLRLESELAAGEMIRIAYSEEALGVSGMAIKVGGVLDASSTVDSNNIIGVTGVSTIDIGVYFTTPIRIRHNNFYSTTAWMQGGIPSETAGNFASDPLFLDELVENFGLTGTSPDISRADPTRWDLIYGQLGITNMQGWTAAGTPARQNITPLGREIDRAGINRYANGETGDIGAYDYDPNALSFGDYAGESGYDYANPGTSGRPYWTADRAFERTPADANLIVNPLPYGFDGAYQTAETGPQVARFITENLVVNDGFMQVGGRTEDDTAVLYPSYQSFQPTGAVYVSVNGSDTGVGTQGDPYRTIGRAMQDNPLHVHLTPGYYPSFQGYTGAKIICPREDVELSLDGTLLTDMRVTRWTTTGTGSLSKFSSSLTLTAPVDILALFNVSPDFILSASTEVTSEYAKVLFFKVSENSFSITFYTSLNKIVLAFAEGATTYEFSYTVSPTLFQSFMLRMGLVGQTANISVDGSTISKSYTFTGLSSTYNLEMSCTGTGRIKLSDPMVSADVFGGITGSTDLCTGTMVMHRAYVIVGSTGLFGETGMRT